jgi:TonB family protein
VIRSNRELIPVYQTILIDHIPRKKSINFTSNFNFNFIITKKRIVMMTTTTSKQKAWYKGIALIPMFIVAICLFSNCESSNKTSADAKDEKTEQQVYTLSKDILTTADVDEQPEFPGGTDEMHKFLSINTKYPIIAQENGIQGRVTLKFVIDTDGTVKDVEVFRGVDPSLDKEAMRVVNQMRRWTTTKKAGQAVAVQDTIPISFRLTM